MMDGSTNIHHIEARGGGEEARTRYLTSPLCMTHVILAIINQTELN